MTPHTPTVNDLYRRYLALLLQHHELLAAGRGDDEIEPVEEEMTRLWEELDGVQRASVSGLSSDLNRVRRRGAPPPRGKKAEDVTDADRQALAAAWKGGEWHEVLHLLRLCAAVMEAGEVASSRAVAWTRIGELDIGQVFARFAEVPGARSGKGSEDISCSTP